MKKRNLVFDNLRGLCMLGVIGIHLGSFVMESATPSPALYILFEVLSRYSVPGFFFISGFGLFYTHELTGSINYPVFLKKRCKSILLPYILWSTFYLYLTDLVYPDPLTWTWEHLIFVFSFGTGMYHLYFLVILFWFYACFPLWRYLMRLLEAVGSKLGLAILFLAQLLLYHSSAHYWSYPAWIADTPWLYNLCQYRLNYLPLFYLFIFMLGGVIARHYEQLAQWSERHFKLLALAFCASAACNTYLFFDFWHQPGATLETVTNALQQLSLPGLIYTIATLSFLCALLHRYQKERIPALQELSTHSFFIYLIHPFFMDQIYYYLGFFGLPFRWVPVFAYYLAVLACSYGAAKLWCYIKKACATHA